MLLQSRDDQFWAGLGEHMAMSIGWGSLRNGEQMLRRGPPISHLCKRGGGSALSTIPCRGLSRLCFHSRGLEVLTSRTSLLQGLEKPASTRGLHTRWQDCGAGVQMVGTSLCDPYLQWRSCRTVPSPPVSVVLQATLMSLLTLVLLEQGQALCLLEPQLLPTGTLCTDPVTLGY